MTESGQVKHPPAIVVDIARFVAFTVSKLLWFIKYTDTHNIPKDLKGGLLIAPNHPTYLDAFWVCAPMRRKFRFMVWDEAFNWFLIGPLIRYLGSFPVKHEGGVTKQAVKEAIGTLKAGATLIVFPEGAREFPDGKLHEFKSGPVRIAMQAGVPILPVTIRGGNRVWPQTFKYPRLFRRVEVIYHPLFEVPLPPEAGETREHVADLTQKLKAVIGSRLAGDDRIRQGDGAFELINRD